jgi:hypothetical protein
VLGYGSSNSTDVAIVTLMEFAFGL